LSSIVGSGGGALTVHKRSQTYQQQTKTGGIGGSSLVIVEAFFWSGAWNWEARIVVLVFWTADGLAVAGFPTPEYIGHGFLPKSRCLIESWEPQKTIGYWPGFLPFHSCLPWRLIFDTPRLALLQGRLNVSLKPAGGSTQAQGSARRQGCRRVLRMYVCGSLDPLGRYVPGT